MGKYREWIIDALNRDLSFDRFVVEQLAGDLLPGATVEQTIATGFLCTAMSDGTLENEHVRLKMAVDRVNLIGTVFLGLTLGCAVPFPQVRPDLATGVLSVLRVLQQHRRRSAGVGVGLARGDRPA